MRLSTFTLIALLALSSPAAAADLYGTVVDREGRPLSGVTVITNVPGLGTATDDDGQYQLNLTDQVSRVTFSAVGFQLRQFKTDQVPEEVILELQYYRGTDIVVSGSRAETGVTPIAFDNLSSDEIDRDYTVGEFPLLLETTPNLYSFADAGTPMGYSYMKIRGFDDKRVVTYINGVPLNDPEDQATYFVDLPDFASNTTDIQIQRGIGNSLYGDASFGGSINIVTNPFAQKRKTSLTAGYGEYSAENGEPTGVYKQSLEYYSGLIDGQWLFSGRYSKQRTGGYRENSWYSGWAYYFSVARLDPNMTTQMQVYGGPMQMHLAYYGVDRATLESNRQYNPLEYDNDTDNFNQPHYQLTNRLSLGDRITLSNTLYYIRGKGFYEQYKDDRSYREYDLLDYSDSSSGDLVRQQWVTKNQVGWNPTLEIDHDRGRHTLGGSFYYFESDHWGQVVWAENVTAGLAPRHRYYQYFGKKHVGSLFGQESYRLTDRLGAQATAQFRYQRYQFDQVRMGAFAGYDYDVDWFFFSPRIGLTYRLSEQTSLFGNFAVASRTPTDAAIYEANDPDILPSLEVLSIDSISVPGQMIYEFGDPTAKSERVYDFELGGEYRNSKVALGVNLFYMDFRDEIIPYGGITDDGLAVTINADRSVHAGIELTGAVRPSSYLTLSGNLALNYNRVKDHRLVLENYDVDWSWLGSDTVDLADKTIPGFPDYLGNLIADFDAGSFRLTGRIRLVGKQFVELLNSDSLAIDPHAVASMSVRFSLTRMSGIGDMSLLLKVDNIFNEKYESSGYGWNYGRRLTPGGPLETINEGEYYVAAERSFYTQVQLDLF